jgi:hypothetical protein
VSQSGDPLFWWIPDNDPPVTPGMPPGEQVVEVFVPLGGFLKTGDPVVFVWTASNSGTPNHLVRVRVDRDAIGTLLDLLVRPVPTASG